MMDMSDALEQYLKLRRSLGFKLQTQESRLRNFVRYAKARGEQRVTAKIAVDWASHQCGPATWSSRLSTVRAFARHLQVIAPKPRFRLRTSFHHHEDRVLSSIQTNRSPIS